MPRLESVYMHSEPQIIGAHLSTRDASEALLARLGSVQHLANIQRELEKAAPEHPSSEQALALEASFLKAAMSGQKTFVPLLCRHINDPGWWTTDYGTMPALTARMAVCELAGSKETTPGRGRNLQRTTATMSRCTLIEISHGRAFIAST